MSTSSRNNICIEILCEFFEVAIHNILYVRKIYPDSIFERRRKYGIVIYQSIHPALNDYIKSCLKGVLFHAQTNQLSKMFLCLSSERVIFEKYVFDILNLNDNIINDSFFVKLEQSFRAYCLKLLTSYSTLPPVPDDATFMIQLLTTEQSSATFNSKPEHEEFPWIHLNQNESNVPSPQIIPLHTVESDIMGIQIYMQKSFASTA